MDKIIHYEFANLMTPVKDVDDVRSFDAFACGKAPKRYTTTPKHDFFRYKEYDPRLTTCNNCKKTDIYNKHLFILELKYEGNEDRFCDEIEK